MVLQSAMRGAVVAAVAVIAILVGVGAGFEYEYATLSGQISELNQTVSQLNGTVSSQSQQISSLSSQVPDSEISLVTYAVTLYSHANGSLYARGYYVDRALGLGYHAGSQVTLYIETDNLINFTGLMNITYIGSRTDGLTVSSISPALPVTVHSGGPYGQFRNIITVVLSTSQSPVGGLALQMYIQAYVVSDPNPPVTS
jgi:hypothetical protein